MSVWCSSYIIVFRAKMHEPTDQTNDELWRRWIRNACLEFDCRMRRRARSTWADPIHKPFMNAALYVIWLDMMNRIIRSEISHFMKYQSPSVGMNHNILCWSFYCACVDITNHMMKIWAHSWTNAIKLYSNVPQIGLIIYFKQK